MADTLVLNTRLVPASTTKYGSYTWTVPAGKSCKVESSPQGVDVLNQTCPAGKTWSVTVQVTIMESDV